MENIKNIVFDFGGVVVTLSRDEAVRRFIEIGLDSAEEQLDSYHQRGAFLALEEGRMSREEFYAEICAMAGKDIPAKSIDYAWFGYLVEIPDSKLKMLEKLRGNYRLYLLSNTNPIIMECIYDPKYWGEGKTMYDYFDKDKLYLSYKIGATKPAEQIFEHLIADSGINPSETLFIDDSLANVQMGESFGMKTFLAENGKDFDHIFDL